MVPTRVYNRRGGECRTPYMALYAIPAYSSLPFIGVVLALKPQVRACLKPQARTPYVRCYILVLCYVLVCTVRAWMMATVPVRCLVQRLYGPRSLFKLLGVDQAPIARVEAKLP